MIAVIRTEQRYFKIDMDGICQEQGPLDHALSNVSELSVPDGSRLEGVMIENDPEVRPMREALFPDESLLYRKEEHTLSIRLVWTKDGKPFFSSVIQSGLLKRENNRNTLPETPISKHHSEKPQRGG